MTTTIAMLIIMINANIIVNNDDDDNNDTNTMYRVGSNYINDNNSWNYDIINYDNHNTKRDYYYHHNITIVNCDNNKNDNHNRY